MLRFRATQASCGMMEVRSQKVHFGYSFWSKHGSRTSERNATVAAGNEAGKDQKPAKAQIILPLTQNIYEDKKGQGKCFAEAVNSIPNKLSKDDGNNRHLIF